MNMEWEWVVFVLCWVLCVSGDCQPSTALSDLQFLDPETKRASSTPSGSHQMWPDSCPTTLTKGPSSCPAWFFSWDEPRPRPRQENLNPDLEVAAVGCSQWARIMAFTIELCSSPPDVRNLEELWAFF